MNKHGQTLVLFIVFLPIFALLGILVVDIGLASREKTKVESTTRIIMDEIREKNITGSIEEEIKILFRENNINIDNLIITIDGNEITIENFYKINSIFGNLIDIKNYRVETKITSIIENRIEFEE